MWSAPVALAGYNAVPPLVQGASARPGDHQHHEHHHRSHRTRRSERERDSQRRSRSPRRDGSNQWPDGWSGGWSDTWSDTSSGKRDQYGFFPDASFYDTGSWYGMQFPRQIPATRWSNERDTAMTDPLEAKVVDYVWKGRENHSMRLLANGRFVMFEAAQSLGGHNLVSSLLWRVRDKGSAHSINLSALADAHARKHDMRIDSNDDKKKVWDSIGLVLRDFLAGGMVTDQPRSAARIAELEAELSAVRAELVKRPLISSPVAGHDVAASIETLLSPLERRSRQRVLEQRAVTTTKSPEVTKLINSIGSLTAQKKKELDKIADDFLKLLNKARGTEKKALQVRIESMLVEWGVAPSVAAKTPVDYRGVARLVATAAAIAE